MVIDTEKLHSCLHEAGHALICIARGLKITNIYAIGDHGATRFYPADIGEMVDADAMIEQALGGSIGVKVAETFPDWFSGSEDDIKLAETYAGGDQRRIEEAFTRTELFMKSNRDKLYWLADVLYRETAMSGKRIYEKIGEKDSPFYRGFHSKPY